MSLAARTKQWTAARNLQKLCAHRDPVPTFVPEYKVETLYSGTDTVPEFERGHLKKECVHISAQRVPYLGTVPGYQMWTLP